MLTGFGNDLLENELKERKGNLEEQREKLEEQNEELEAQNFELMECPHHGTTAIRF
jgi:peptidoglycan hydrolase CwlO-like protein